MPKLLGSPGTRVLFCRCVFLPRRSLVSVGWNSLVPGAHVDTWPLWWVALPAMCCNSACSVLAAAAFRTQLEGEGTMLPLKDCLMPTAFAPISHWIWLLRRKTLGSASDPVDASAGVLGKGTETLLPVYLSHEVRQYVSVLLSFPGPVLSYARHNGSIRKERHRNLFFPFKQAPAWGTSLGAGDRRLKSLAWHFPFLCGASTTPLFYELEKVLLATY